MAQSVERHLGKVEVAGSIPAISSNFQYKMRVNDNGDIYIIGASAISSNFFYWEGVVLIAKNDQIFSDKGKMVIANCTENIKLNSFRRLKYKEII